MGRPDYIFGQFRETARCRDAQHGDGVCCAFAPQLVLKLFKLYATAVGSMMWPKLTHFIVALNSECKVMQIINL